MLETADSSTKLIEDLHTRIMSLETNRALHAIRIHDLEQEMDILCKSPWWKQLWWAIDGWPLTRIAERRQWRPWHGHR